MANTNKELRRHKVADTVKWIIAFLLIFAAIAAIAVMMVKLDRQTTVTKIGAEMYSVGAIADDGTAEDVDTSIVTNNAFTTDGLTVTIADDATVTYALYFYDADGEFISATEELSADFDGTIPEGAETAKIVVTPAEDEDGKVTLTEIVGYANQVTVQVNR